MKAYVQFLRLDCIYLFIYFFAMHLKPHSIKNIRIGKMEKGTFLYILKEGERRLGREEVRGDWGSGGWERLVRRK